MCHLFWCRDRTTLCTFFREQIRNRVEDNGEMSLRDVSDSVPLAIMAERDIRSFGVCINNIFLYHLCSAPCWRPHINAETGTGDNIVDLFDFSRGAIKIRNCKEICLKPSVLALCYQCHRAETHLEATQASGSLWMSHQTKYASLRAGVAQRTWSSLQNLEHKQLWCPNAPSGHKRFAMPFPKIPPKLF